MKIRLPNIASWTILIFFLCNLGIFFYANTIPIHWTQDEFFNYGFFWSMDDIHKFTLHAGLTKEDFPKIFCVKYIDEVFRTRQFYTLFEMLTFKFWQVMGKVLLRNHTLILLHLLNSILLGTVVFRITSIKRAGWIAFLSALNCGIGLTTPALN